MSVQEVFQPPCQEVEEPRVSDAKTSCACTNCGYRDSNNFDWARVLRLCPGCQGDTMLQAVPSEDGAPEATGVAS